MSSIQLHNLRKEFGPVVAVENLSLEISDGEFVALLGPSGCGKTTTMNMISGLEVPTYGDIFFDEHRMNDVPPNKRGIGFVFQNYAIFTHMSVLENIAFGLKLAKRSPEEIRQKTEAVADLLYIRHLLPLNAGRLSVNDMQKVALGRSMVMEPGIFLLDEPFSNLDATFRFYMRGMLKQIQREIEQTMIYVTHDQVEAMSMADRIAVMDFGVLQQFGTPDEVYNRPVNKFVAGFIGSPQMNFMEVEYLVEDGTGYLQLVGSPNRVAVDQPKQHLLETTRHAPHMVLGVRPEAIVLSESEADSTWTGTVILVEPLGAKTVVHLDVGGESMHAVAPAMYRPSLSTQQPLSFDMERTHVFAADTGQAIW